MKKRVLIIGVALTGVSIFASDNGNFPGHKLAEIQLLGQICGQVAAAVGDDDIVPHKSIALLFFFVTKSGPYDS